MDIGMPELLIILGIVILLFGVGRISKVAGELGSGLRAFKEGLNGDEAQAAKPEAKVSEPVEPAKTEVKEHEPVEE